MAGTSIVDLGFFFFSQPGHRHPSHDLRRRPEQAAQIALADMERSQALVKAREAVEQQIQKWNKELAPPPVHPTVAAEIRAHVLRLKDGDRLPFVTKHIADARPAVTQGPSFLSGLTPAEVDIVRRDYESTRNPAEAKTKAMGALMDCEQGRCKCPPEAAPLQNQALPDERF